MNASMTMSIFAAALLLGTATIAHADGDSAGGWSCIAGARASLPTVVGQAGASGSAATSLTAVAAGTGDVVPGAGSDARAEVAGQAGASGSAATSVAAIEPGAGGTLRGAERNEYAAATGQAGASGSAATSVAAIEPYPASLEAIEPAAGPAASISERQLRSMLAGQGYSNVADVRCRDGAWLFRAARADAGAADMRLDPGSGTLDIQ